MSYGIVTVFEEDDALVAAGGASADDGVVSPAATRDTAARGTYDAVDGAVIVVTRSQRCLKGSACCPGAVHASSTHEPSRGRHHGGTAAWLLV